MRVCAGGGSHDEFVNLPVQYLIFDLDGTLVVPAHLDDSFRQAAVEYDADSNLVELTMAEAFRHQPFELSAAAALATFEDDPRVTSMTARFWELVDEQAPAVALPDARETLQRLHEHGFTLLLSTGSPPTLAQSLLDRHGWADLFTLAHGSTPEFDKGEHHLPAFAEHVGLSLEAFAQTAATIGDGRTEIRWGTQLNMPLRVGVLAPDGGNRSMLLEAGATHLIERLSELLPLLGLETWAPFQ